MGQKAINQYLEVIEIKKKRLGSNNFSVLKSYCLMAQCLVEFGTKKEITAYFERTKEIFNRMQQTHKNKCRIYASLRLENLVIFDYILSSLKER